MENKVSIPAIKTALAAPPGAPRPIAARLVGGPDGGIDPLVDQAFAGGTFAQKLVRIKLGLENAYEFLVHLNYPLPIVRAAFNGVPAATDLTNDGVYAPGRPNRTNPFVSTHLAVGLF